MDRLRALTGSLNPLLAIRGKRTLSLGLWPDQAPCFCDYLTRVDVCHG